MTVVAIWSDSSLFYSYKYSDNIYTQIDTNLPWSVEFHAEKNIITKLWRRESWWCLFVECSLSSMMTKSNKYLRSENYVVFPLSTFLKWEVSINLLTENPNGSIMAYLVFNSKYLKSRTMQAHSGQVSTHKKVTYQTHT